VDYNEGSADFYTCVKNFVGAFPNSILLVELGGLTNLNEAVKCNLLNFLNFRVQYVVSLSSGNESLSSVDESKAFKDRMTTLYTASGVEFCPFTKKQACVFMKELHPGKYELEDGFYRGLTNYNPLLLSVCGNCDKDSAKQNVRYVVRNYLNEIDCSLKKWVQGSLKESMVMLYYAYNCEKLAISELDTYETTLVSVENITYIVEKDRDSFKLAVNFPTLFNGLMSKIALYKDMLVFNYAIINECLFEKAMKGMEKLKVLYCRQDDWVTSSATFHFNEHVSSDLNTPVKELRKNVLYHLRPKHPAIDAVGFFVLNEEPWLLMIQTSLSPYKNHESKAEDLKNPISGCERESGSKAKDWLAYYRGCVDKNDGLRCMYVYISPEECLDIGRPSDRLVQAEFKDLYLGLVLKSSKSASFIINEKAKLLNVS
jgi:hypothetical protein